MQNLLAKPLNLSLTKVFSERSNEIKYINGIMISIEDIQNAMSPNKLKGKAGNINMDTRPATAIHGKVRRYTFLIKAVILKDTKLCKIQTLVAMPMAEHNSMVTKIKYGL